MTTIIYTITHHDTFGFSAKDCDLDEEYDPDHEVVQYQIRRTSDYQLYINENRLPDINNWNELTPYSQVHYLQYCLDELDSQDNVPKPSRDHLSLEQLRDEYHVRDGPIRLSQYFRQLVLYEFHMSEQVAKYCSEICNNDGLAIMLAHLLLKLAQDEIITWFPHRAEVCLVAIRDSQHKHRYSLLKTKKEIYTFNYIQFRWD